MWFLNVITSVPPTTAKALIQGLKHDLLADDRALRALIPQDLIRFDDAVRHTLKEEEKLVNSSDWGYDAQAFARWRPEYGYYRSRPALPSQPRRAWHRCGKPSTRLAAKSAIFSAIFSGKRAARWICWSVIGWRKAALRIPGLRWGIRSTAGR
ncbi:NAD-dependent epimerase/dehydratase [Enterobacter cancerogenus]|uniref:NAD-dependent epimerase/dehydratase n=1 Tax=Enterobacter cancerogenus TaxID=69218 RepID=A0A484Z6L1_9ENTR|nr:NAD-dependent epimerase/dehydratase [Enterobacter cancerogenus]